MLLTYIFLYQRLFPIVFTLWSGVRVESFSVRLLPVPSVYCLWGYCWWDALLQAFLHFDNHSLLRVSRQCVNMQEDHNITVSISATSHHKIDANFSCPVTGKLGKCFNCYNLNWIMQMAFMIKFCQDSCDHVFHFTYVYCKHMAMWRTNFVHQ